MPAAFLGVRLIGACRSLSACPVRSLSASIYSLVPFVVPPVSASPFTTLGARNICQHSLPYKRLQRVQNFVKTAYQVKSYMSTSQKMTTNGETRSKRKKSPVKVLDRPSKIIKHDSYPETMENTQSPDDGIYSMEIDGEDHISLPPIAAMVNSAEWQETIEKVVRNVVSIRFCQTCSFDTDSAVSSEATGFVVDAERGYILTNRHVVGAGPFWGFCIFDNHEEVGRAQISDLYPCTDIGPLVRRVSCLP